MGGSWERFAFNSHEDYTHTVRSWHFGCAKAPGGFDCRNRVHIPPIDPFTAIESWKLSHCPNAHFSGCLGIN